MIVGSGFLLHTSTRGTSSTLPDIVIRRRPRVPFRTLPICVRGIIRYAGAKPQKTSLLGECVIVSRCFSFGHELVTCLVAVPIVFWLSPYDPMFAGAEEIIPGTLFEPAEKCVWDYKNRGLGENVRGLLGTVSNRFLGDLFRPCCFRKPSLFYRLPFSNCGKCLGTKSLILDK